MSSRRISHFNHDEATALVGREVRAASAARTYGLDNGTRGTVTGVRAGGCGDWMVEITWEVEPAMVLGRRRQIVDVFQRFDWERYVAEVAHA